MPPKKSRSAKSKKGRSRSRSRSRSKSRRRSGKGKGKKLAPEQASAVLTFLMVEARKQSILMYRAQFIEQREETKRLREKLRRVEQERYGHMRNLIDTTDAISAKLEKMHDGKGTVGEKLDLALDDKLSRQREDIQVLYDTINSLSNRLTSLTEQIRALQSTDINALEAAVSAFRAEHASQIQAKEDELDRLNKRHHKSIQGTRTRGERLVGVVEGVASQHEIDAMSALSLRTLQRNKKLRELVAAAEIEVKKLDNVVEELEEKNMDRLVGAIEVDWNLGVGLLAGVELGDNGEDVYSELASEVEFGDDSDGNEDGEREGDGRGRPAIRQHHTKTPPRQPPTQSQQPSRSSTPTLPILHPTPRTITSTQMLTPQTVIARETLRKDLETSRIGLILGGNSMALRQPDVKNAGGCIFYGGVGVS